MSHKQIMLKTILNINVVTNVFGASTLVAAAMLAAQALACPVSLQLGPLATPQSFADKASRDLSSYMLRGLVDETQPQAFVDTGHTWTIDCAALSDRVTPQQIAATLSEDGAVDPRLVRLLYEQSYYQSLSVRGQEPWAPESLAQLLTETRYLTWPHRIVEVSAIKQKSRRIFRSPPGFLPVISISETLDTTTGDEGASVLETEVAIKRRNSEDWDFYSYDHGGARVPWGMFPAGRRPAPQICMNCHYDSGTGAVERFFP